MSTSENQGPGEIVAGGSLEPDRRLNEVLDRARTDPGLGELLHAVEAVHSSLRVDTAYLAEAVAAEQRQSEELRRRNQELARRESEAAERAALKDYAVDRLRTRTEELERALEETELRAEADRLAILTERDTAIERLMGEIRSLEAENERLTTELADLRQRVRPIDVAVERYADPGVVLLIDGDELAMRGWGGIPVSIARSRVMATLSRLAEDRDATVEVVFGSPEGLDPEELPQLPIRVRVISNGFPMEEALIRLQEEHPWEDEVAVVTDHPGVVDQVPVSRLVELLGMPSTTGRAYNSARSVSVGR
ncbi:MAG: hypothetical protein AAF547_23000 [Actinomycetota bacterium]